MDKIKSLRKFLKSNGLHGIIVPSNDPHFSEYIAPCWKYREYLTGFTGSAGTAVVTLDKAAVWVDSRYYVQIDSQCAGTEFVLHKIGLAGTPSIEQWVAENTPKNSTIAVDGKLYSCNNFNTTKILFRNHGIELVACSDPFADIWQNRPQRPVSLVKIMPIECSGEGVKSKIDRVVEMLDLYSNDAYYIMTSLDEIAWLLNIRGADVSFNPVVISYATVSSNGVKLFLDNNKILDKDLKYFADNSIEVASYDMFSDWLASLKGFSVVYNPNKLDVYHYEVMLNAGVVLEQEACSVGVVNRMKSIKNKIEIEGFEKAMIDDGVALSKFYCWLHDQVKNGVKISEWELGKRLVEFKESSKLYVSESFAPIVASADNAAMPHYSAPEIGSKDINNERFLLIDVGSQYSCGTTDITRTVTYKTLSDQEKLDYTLVLQGMIDLTQLVFPINTRGAQLDIVARKALLSEGMNYGHGTGHGIGHFLNVHEGPQSIRAESNPEVIKAGMVMSVEPGVYKVGEYGIRIENVVVCESHSKNQFGEFLKFRTLTLFPIDTKPILIERLSVTQRQWLNRYHARVYDTLSPHLSSEEQVWLAQRTKAI